MISYDTYQNRIKKLAAVKNFIVRFRALFISFFALIIALTSAFLFSKGMITSDFILPQNIVYGDSYASSIVQPKALFSDVYLEFCPAITPADSGVTAAKKRVDGEAESAEQKWTRTPPTLAGTYLVRTVSDKIIGSGKGKPKQFEISPRTAEFIIDADSVVYGSSPLQNNYTFELINGDTLYAENVTFDYENPELSITSVCANSQSFKIFSASGEDVTYCYNIVTPMKENVTLISKPVTLTPASLEFTYSGAAQSLDISLDAASLHLLGGDSATVSATVYRGSEPVTEVVEAGVYTLKIDSVQIYHGEANVSERYDANFLPATIIVQKRAITISTPSDSKQYDATALSCGEPQAEGLVEGHILSRNESVSEYINAGTYKNAYTFSISDAEGNDLTSNYKIDYNYGTLEITQRPVTIITSSNSKEYDGTPVSSAAYSVAEDTALLEGHTGTVTAVTEITHVWQSGTPNALSVSIFNADGDEVTQNYAVTYQNGSLSITARSISVATASTQWVYDGAPHSYIEELVFSRPAGEDGQPAQDTVALADGDSYAVSTAATITDVGTAPNALSFTFADQYGVDVTADYTVAATNGTLTVIKADLQIVTATIERPYNGRPLLGSDAEPDKTGIADGEFVEPADVTSLSGIGQAENATTYTVYAIRDGEKVLTTDNYNIDYSVKGTLTVVKAELIITTPTLEMIFNGTTLSGDGAAPALDGIAEGEYVLPVNPTTVYNAKQVENDTTYKVYRDIIASDIGQKEETTDCYEISYIKGTLTVLPRPILITTPTATKEFDGAPFSATQDFTVEYNGERTEDIEYPALILSSLFTLSVKPGTTPASVTYVTEGLVTNVVEYYVHMVSLYEDSESTSEGEGAGSNFTVDISVMDATSDYEISYVYGTISRTVRNIEVTTASEERVYDATEWINTDCTSKYIPVQTEQEEEAAAPIIPALVLNHKFVPSSYTAITEVDSVANVCEYIIADEDTDVTANYHIDYVYGALTVTPRPVLLTTLDSGHIYDDSAFTYTQVSAQPFDKDKNCGIVPGHRAEWDNGEAASVTYVSEGEVENIFACLIFDGDTNVSRNYTIEYNYGKIHIDKRPVLITTPTDMREFNGQPFVSTQNYIAEYSGEREDGVDYPGLVNGQSLIVKPDTTPASVVYVSEGKVKNTVEYSIVSSAASTADSAASLYDDNYQLTYKEGTISVYARNITVTTNTTGWVYDAEEHYDYGHSEAATTDKGSALVLDHTLKVDDGYAAITDVGSKDNECGYTVITADGNDVSVNYKITYSYGILTITHRSVTIQTPTKDKVYDSQPFSCTEGWLVAEGSEYALVSRHTLKVKTGTTPSTVTDVSEGKVENIVEYVVMDGEKDVTYNYNLVHTYGSIWRTPRPVTVTTESKAKVYDGTPLYHEQGSVDAFDAQNDCGIVATHHIVLDESKRSTFGNVTYVHEGEVDNALYYLIEADSVAEGESRDKSVNYAITYVYGKLSITARPMHITTASYTKVYDGVWLFGHYTFNADQSDTGGLSFENIVEGDTPIPYNITMIIAAGSIKNATSYRFTLPDGTDYTSSYDITKTEGTLTINRRPLTITNAAITKIYDGTPLLGDSVAPEIDGIVLGEQLALKGAPASITDVGEVANTTDYTVNTVRDGVTVDTTDSYTVTHIKTNKLTVTPRPIHITTSDANSEYNGQFFSYTADWSVTYDGDSSKFGLVEGHTLKPVSGSETKVLYATEGQKDNIVRYRVYAGEKDVTANYSYDEYSYTYGKIWLTKRKIFVTTATWSWVYDADEHSLTVPINIQHRLDEHGFVVDEEDALVDGHGLEVLAGYAAITNVGRKQNVCNYTVKTTGGAYAVSYDGADQVLADNYDIAYEFGYLEVTKRPVKIHTNAHEWQYDGIEHSDYGATAKQVEGNADSGLVAATHTHRIELDSDKSGTFSKITYFHEGKDGEIDNKLIHKIFDESDNDVTSNYAIDYVYGKLKITPRPITIKNATYAIIYNGEYLYGEPSKNVAHSGLDDGGVRFENKVEGDTPVAYDITSIIDAGEVENTTKYTIHATINGVDTDITSSYIIKPVNGKLKISPKPITVSAPTLSKVYDGDPLVGDTQAPAIDSLVPGEGYETDGEPTKITDAGTTPNLTKYKFYTTRNGVKVYTTGNYTPTYDSAASLTVTPRPIHITTGTSHREFDGEEFYYTDGWSVSYEGDSQKAGLVKSHVLKYIAGTETRILYATDGEVDNIVRYKVYDGEKDVTANYTYGDENYTYRKIWLDKREIQVTTYSRDWVYDAEPHYYTDCKQAKHLKGGVVDDSASALVMGHVLEVVAGYATITDVGKKSNECAYTVKDANGLYVNGKGAQLELNYNINYIYGELEITPRPIIITTGTDSKVYDGTALEKHTATPEAYNAEGQCGLVAPKHGHRIELDSEKADTFSKITYFHEGTGNTGAIENKLVYKLFDGADNDVTRNYAITYVCGTLTITPRPITITTSTFEKVYDGAYLYGDSSKNPDTSDKGGLDFGDKVAADTAVPADIASIIDVGQTENATTYTIHTTIGVTDTDISSSYAISYKKGTLKITKRSLTITTPDVEKIYDGTPLLGDVIQPVAIGIVSGESTVTSGNAASITNVSESGAKNTTRYKITTERDGTTVDTTDNYAITYGEDGTMTVTPRPIKLTPASADKEFDGQPFSYTDDCKDSYNGIDGQKDGLVNGHTLAVKPGTTPASVTYVTEGKVQNVVQYIVMDGKNDVTGNYLISYDYTNSFIERTARNVKATSPDGTWVYDGKEHSAYDNASTAHLDKDGKRDSEASLVLEHSLENLTHETITDVGEKSNVCTYKVVDKKGDDVSANYNLVYTDSVDGYGKLEVTRREITIKPVSYPQYTYGTPVEDYTDAYGNFEYVTGSEQLVAGEMLKISVIFRDAQDKLIEGKPENAGVYKVLVDGDHLSMTGGTLSNYTIKAIEDTLTIVRKKVRISLNTLEGKVFDGEVYEYDSSDFEFVSGDSMAYGQVLKVAAICKQNNALASPRNAGTYTFEYDTLNSMVECGTGSDKTYVAATKNYEIECVNTTDYTITKRPFTVTLVDYEATYDSTIISTYNNIHTQKAGEVENEGLLEYTYLVDYDVSAHNGGKEVKPQNAGVYTLTADSSNYSIMYLLGETRLDETNNYIMTEIPSNATLTVSPRDLHVYVTDYVNEYTGAVQYMPTDQYKSYNDTALQTPGITMFDLPNVTPVYSYTLSGVPVTDPLEIGVYTATITGFTSTDPNFENNYNLVSSESGKFEICKKVVIIKPVAPDDLEYTGAIADLQWFEDRGLDYKDYTAKNPDKGFADPADRAHYTATYTLYCRTDGRSSTLNSYGSLLQAGIYYLTVRLTPEAGYEPPYDIRFEQSDEFAVSRRLIYSVVTPTQRTYVYNGQPVDDSGYTNEIHYFKDRSFDELYLADAATHGPITLSLCYTILEEGFGIEPISEATDAHNYAVNIGSALSNDGFMVRNYMCVESPDPEQNRIVILPAPLVLKPVGCSVIFDGVSAIYRFGYNCFTIAAGEYYGDPAEISVRSYKYIDLNAPGASLIERVSIDEVYFGNTLVYVSSAGHMYSNYNIVCNMQDFAEYNYLTNGFRDTHFIANLKLAPRTVRVIQRDPPESMRNLEYRPEGYTLDFTGDGSQYFYVVDDSADPTAGLIPGHRLILTGTSIKPIGTTTKWLVSFAVIDTATGADMSAFYKVSVTAPESTYITVSPKTVLIAIYGDKLNGSGELTPDMYTVLNGLPEGIDMRVVAEYSGGGYVFYADFFISAQLSNGTVKEISQNKMYTGMVLII